LYLRGTTTGNSATSVQKAWTYSFLHKEESGTWTVGDVDIGQINLSAGKLVINGTSVTPWSSFNFTAGTLAGTGTINDAITVPSGGTLSPGDATGTLTITNNNCTINSGGTLLIEIDDGASPKNGALDIDPDNTLTITGSTLDFNVSGSAAESSYTIATYGSGKLTGTFGTTNNLPAGYEVNYGATSITITPESTPPSPTPLTWSSAPAGLNATKITMTATTATDDNGPVEYYFENLTNSANSGWTTSETWVDTNLTSGVTYGYQVKARDRFGNETAVSTPVAMAQPLASDSTAPTPSPMTWSSAPAATSPTQVVMTCSTASDPSTPIHYFFENVTLSVDSGWISGTTWTNSGLSAETTYAYRVKARDGALNETAWSTPNAEATTPENTPPSPSPMVFEVAPAALDHTRIVMTATNASDASLPVQYYFENTTNSANSGWMTSRVWTNDSLTLGTVYGYRVKAKDAVGNETDWSAESTASPAYETTPPDPSPMTFAVAPALQGDDAVVMTATTATDALSSPVEYYFENTTNSQNSGWISGTVWTNTSLTADATYGYTVMARDARSNETVVSSEATVYVPRAPATVYWDGPNTGGVGDGDGASQGGTAAWDTSTQNWDDGSDRVAWYNGADTAIIGGANGTATLGEAISLRHLRFIAGTHSVAGNTLNFAGSGSITTEVNNVDQTITSQITGSPDVAVASNASQDKGLKFAPTSGTQILGVITMAYEDGDGDKCAVTLAGSTTGNTVESVTYAAGHQWANLRKDGTGEWTVQGNINNGTVEILAGDLVVGGEITTKYRGVELKGGTLHYNSAGTIKSGGFKIQGGDLDNSSGAAISTSTYNPAQSWNADFTFVGSNGSNSDLNLGTGTATLSANRTVTIQNAAATLTVGGVVTDGGSSFGLTKAGPGTLDLNGNNTYNGNTTVEAGTLSVAYAYFDDASTVAVSNGATLNLDFVGTDTVTAIILNGSLAAPGSWGAIGSGADNESSLITGTGMLTHSGGLGPANTWYWDGPLTGGNGNTASDGGSGTWSTSVDNWDHGLVARSTWQNGADEMAVFAGSSGTVTLGSDVTLKGIQFNEVGGYTIAGASSLNFASGGWVTSSVDVAKYTFTTPITGSPAVGIPSGSHSPSYNEIEFAPTSGSQTLGICMVPYNDGSGDKARLRLGGTTTGNSVAEIRKSHNYAHMVKEGSGTWTVGDVDIGIVYLNAGKLVVNGALSTSYVNLSFSGGTLAGTGVIDDPVSVPVSGTLAPGDPTGTLTVTNNNCTISGTLAVTASGGQVSAVEVDGTLDISSADLDITGASGTVPLVIAGYNTLVGTFTSTNGLPALWRVDYDYEGGNQIAIKPPGASIFLFK